MVRLSRRLPVVFALTVLLLLYSQIALNRQVYATPSSSSPGDVDPLLDIGISPSITSNATLSPATQISRPTSHSVTGATVTNPAWAYNWDFADYATISRDDDGYFDLTPFNNTNMPTLNGMKLTAVDFNIKFSAEAGNDDTYRIYYLVGTTPAAADLVPATAAGHALANYTWASQPEPINGEWSAADVAAVKLRFEINQAGKSEHLNVYVYEAWLTLKYMGKGPTVNIDITDASNLGGWEINMSFNPDVLQVVGYNYVDDPNFFYDHFVWTETINNDAGWARWVITLPLGTTQGVDGSGTVANITFLYAPGTTVLDMHGTVLGNPVGSPFPHQTYDGYFSSPPITVNPPVPSFTFTPSAPYLNEPVSFDASASYAQSPTPRIVTYFWDFGDTTNTTKYGDLSADPTVTRPYTQSGTHTVNMTVVDRYNLRTYTTMSITVKLLPAIGISPSVIYNTSSLNTVDIHISGASNLSGYDLTIRFNPDVLNVTEVNYIDDANFFYDHYVWTETINNNTGLIRLNVTLPLGTTVGVDGSGDVANITFLYLPNPTTNATALDMRLTSLTDPAGNPYVHEWYDGYFTDQPSSVHPAYPTVTFSFDIDLDPQTPAPSYFEADERIWFDGFGCQCLMPGPKIVKYIWDFDDGTTRARYDDLGPSSLMAHQYAANGTYTVKLTVVDRYNLSNYLTKDVTVGTAVVPEFPFGAALEISLVVAVIYVWWRSRGKIRRVHPTQR